MIRMSLPVAAVIGMALVGAEGPAVAAPSSGAVDAMTLYGDGAAVVQDRRRVSLKKGGQQIDWPVAGRVRTATFWLAGSDDDVTLDSFSQAAGPAVSDTDPLAARIGLPVRLLRPTPKTKPEQGILEAVDNGIAYVRVGGDIRRITPASPITIEWAGGVETRNTSAGPPLTLRLSATEAGKQVLTASYQVDASGWQASTTGRFDPKNGRLALHSVAVIDNAGHAALAADQAWLVAGDVSRADSGGPRPMMAMAKARTSDAGGAGAPRATGDVYRYPLPGGLHVPAGATQAISLMPPATVTAERRYRAESSATGTYADRRHVASVLGFTNTTGRPLPGGPVRIYDSAHAAQLMGGTTLDDTPAGAPVDLVLGQAFDLTFSHEASSMSSAGQTSYQVKIDLFNAGDSAKQITLVEQLPRFAKIADDAPEPSGGSASMPSWQVSVPAHGQRMFRYGFSVARPYNS